MKKEPVSASNTPKDIKPTPPVPTTAISPTTSSSSPTASISTSTNAATAATATTLPQPLLPGKTQLIEETLY